MLSYIRGHFKGRYGEECEGGAGGEAEAPAAATPMDALREKLLTSIVIEAAAKEDERKAEDERKIEELKGSRMEGVEPASMHGFLGDPNWAAPLVTNACAEEARPGYTSMRADEFAEDKHVLRAKVKVLAAMIADSKNMTAYTGAGISTSSGIGDYATKAKASKAARPKLRSMLEAKPTLAHHVLTALYREGHLRHWVQQNHDGLPQKAGFPQHALNEIHGAWQDPSNPVVPMSGSLRSDLFAWLGKARHETDLTLAMGSSLCGMNADSMVTTPARKAMNEGVGLGAVIVGLQRTQYDDVSSLRIFAKIDQVMALLAEEMGFADKVGTAGEMADTSPLRWLREKGGENLVAELRPIPGVFRVPYDPETGRRVDVKKVDKLMQLDVRPGARVRLTDGPGKGFEGVMSAGRSAEGHWRVELPHQREGCATHGKGKTLYLMGTWWVTEALQGLLPALPIVNV